MKFSTGSGNKHSCFCNIPVYIPGFIFLYIHMNNKIEMIPKVNNIRIVKCSSFKNIEMPWAWDRYIDRYIDRLKH